MKLVSGKRGKTETDYEEMAHIEFIASLYVDEDGPVLPASNIEAMLIMAAKKYKEGLLAKAGMYVKDNPSLHYKGSRDPEEMFKDEKLRDTRAVAVQRSRVMRTRAIFQEWEADVVVAYEDGVINETRVAEWMRIGGTAVGLCEMRPRYGRFEVI